MLHFTIRQASTIDIVAYLVFDLFDNGLLSL